MGERLVFGFFPLSLPSTQKVQVQTSGCWSVCTFSGWVSLLPLRAESWLLAAQELGHRPASDPTSWASECIGLFKINVLPD